MRLSDHFTLADLTFSETALRHGIDQSKPPPHIVKNLRELAYVLEDVKRMTLETPLIISGWRTPKVNALVGGSKTSAHMLGLAADIRCPKFGTALELCRAVADDIVLRFDQCIHEYNWWCHLGIGPKNRRMLLTKQKGKLYKAGLF